MRKVLVIGGKLQGTEVTYLAKKAGYYTIVADRREQAPAFGLADESVMIDILEEQENALTLFTSADVVIPAMENEAVLRKVLEYGDTVKVPVIFDLEAYQISSSKQLSNELFEKLSLPLPGKYPVCSYPVIIKPDGLSGSEGVHKVYSKVEADKILKEMEPNAVVQEYLEGRSFSLEVIGNGETFYFPQITEVVIDHTYDCKRIIAPAVITDEQAEQFYEIGNALAKALRINGIFDIEVICHNGILKLLEIDARFPSQTPISVYQSSGINMIQMLVELKLGQDVELKQEKEEVCCYQQISVDGDCIRVIGEHILADCESLHLQENFFGANEGITDYKEGATSFKAILIVTEKSQKEAYYKFLHCIERIKEKFGNRNMKLIEA